MKQHSNASPYHFAAGVFASEMVEVENGKQIFYVVADNGKKELLDVARLYKTIEWAQAQCGKSIDTVRVVREAQKNMFDGITPSQILDAFVLAASSFIERDPVYGRVAACLLLKKLFKAVTGYSIAVEQSNDLYRRSFIDAIKKGIDVGLLDRRMGEYDLSFLADHLVIERDALFDYMGMRTLYDRYFLKCDDGERLELPQAFWMRIAMGLSYNEEDKNGAALQFYTIMSQMRYVPSTPTLLHSGLTRPQLSSCFLSTVQDDLVDIFKSYSDSAQLAKWSGGVAVDWTNIRACGAIVKSIHTESQGLIPFLKINSDTVAAINRSGKRRGAAVVYLETWHLEIEDFLDLRKNTGDERRRTHDINTANWIPDLFMKRVQADQEWTLFSPHDVPELHHVYGKEFEKKYCDYEVDARSGKIALYKTISAKQLWRKMLSRLFETGHPWITFKDACNVRSPQDHVGVVHSSNLCTEITLNTSVDEIAVCNLGSINLANHVVNGDIDKELLAHTVAHAVHMLDNVIDINYYPIPETKKSNLRHRPIGLGIMGFQDVLYKRNINFSSQEAIECADEIMEYISFHAIMSSSRLAQKRGTYETYKGSKWDRSIFPNDTLALLEQERNMVVDAPRREHLDWSKVRDHVKKYGMRNSNVMAIAPTATIANIAGVFPSIEPIYKNMYVKANMSGEFTVVNKYLIEDLTSLGLWNEEMLELIKYYDGNLELIDVLPLGIKNKYKDVFAIDPLHLIRMSAARGRWIDQSMAHNVFMKGVSGVLLDDIYMTAWKTGLKSTYYLRTLGASQIEKSTLDAGKFGFTQKRIYKMSQEVAQENGVSMEITKESVVTRFKTNVTQSECRIDNSDCEACQ